MKGRARSDPEAGDGEQQRHIGDRDDDDEPALHGLKILPCRFCIRPAVTQSQLGEQVHRGFRRMMAAASGNHGRWKPAFAPVATAGFCYLACGAAADGWKQHVMTRRVEC
jgi:hypothetical protein